MSGSRQLNKEKAQVGVFSVIVKTADGSFEALDTVDTAPFVR